MTTAERPLILIVEDQPLLRVHAHLALEEAGFAVCEAGDAAEALVLLEKRRDILAVFTDVRMPGAMDGVALARTVHERWPQLTVVVTSGMTAVPADQLPPGTVYLPKPYTAAQITKALRHRLPEVEER